MNCCNVTSNRQPGISYYVDFGENAEICIVPNSGVSELVSEHGSDSQGCFDTIGYRSNGSAKPVG